VDLLSIKNILKFISAIGIGISIFLFSAIVVGWIYHEDMRYFLYYDVFLLMISAGIFASLRNHDMRLNIQDGILSVNLVWILLGIIGAIPLSINEHLSFSNAFFESVSAFTTTGATIFADVESLQHSTLYMRSLMHWLGGMGIIVLGVGLFSLINPSGSMALFKAESTGIKMEKITPKIRHTAIRLWGVYVALTLIDMISLKLAGMGWFDALNHAFSTISTGGFSTKNHSIGYFESDMITWITTVFMIISGINFLAHLRFFISKDASGYKREEVVWYIGVFIVLSVGLSFVNIIVNQHPFWQSITNSFFTIASILTTTGFSTTNYALWGQLAISIIIISMLVGGNAGSTAGGIKVIRHIILFKNIKIQMTKIMHPSTVTGVFVDKKKISSLALGATTGFIFLAVITSTMLTLYLYARGFDAMTALSTSLATIGNIGPGFGLVGPVYNYSFFTSMDKVILAIAMIIGRLEFYTVFILFSSSFWKKF